MLRLIGLDLCLSALAIVAVLGVLANDHPTTTERTLVWISAGALPILLTAPIALLVRATRTSHFFEVAEAERGP